MKKIAVFVSGSGTNLQAIIDACESGYISQGKIEIVFSNKKDAYGLQRAKKHNIKTMYLDPENFNTREEYDRVVAGKMNDIGIDLICLAGYMRILTKIFLDTFKGKIMNIHPALLPAFGGKGMYGIHVHEAVLKAGVKESGCTVHFVDYGTDTGPVIFQRKVPVLKGDTPQTLQKRVLEQEHLAYKEAIKLFTEDKLQIIGNKVKIKE
ncbi:MAG: phosphoribosylglycinamide formyltransferase [Candidatus Goldbacteria bacterium]|nr:phosphoribosylglycinamide formyltransferase [Candidatus Goldiibacteriota bacterium]